MKYDKLTVNGLPIFYAIAHEQKEETIFFIHSNSSSARSWHQQFNDPQLSRYRLVAPELPGHGHSFFSQNPELDYSPVETGRIMAEAVSQLNDGNPYVLAGFSYGTNLIAEMLCHGSSPSGIVTIGMCCIGNGFGLEKVFKKTEIDSVFLYNENNEDLVKGFIDFAVENRQARNLVIGDYARTDTNLRPNMFKAVLEGKFTDEIKSLSSQHFPVCVLFGERENLVNVNYANDSGIPFWRGQPVLIRDAGHFVHLDAADAFDGLLAEYAAEQFKAARAQRQN